LQRIYTLIAAVAAILISAQTADAAERRLLMSGFKDLVIENDIAVELTTGKTPKAIVTGDKKELSRVKLIRRGDALINQLSNARRRQGEPLKLMLQNRSLENITIRGNGELITDSLSNSGEASILVHGGGLVKIGSLKANRLVATVIGNGNVSIDEGAVDAGLIEVQGGAQVDASAVNFNKLDVTHDGNGKTTANVKQAVNIFNNGRGKITITGSANCFIKQAGSAVIDCPKYAN